MGAAPTKRARVDEAGSGQSSPGTTRLEMPEVYEPGWAGVALHPSDRAQVAASHECSKCVVVFQGARAAAILPTTQYPSRVQWVSVAGTTGSSQLAVLEGNHLAIYDPRMSDKRRQCAQRITVGCHPLYAVSARDSYIAAAGDDCMASFFDVRSWSRVGR